jgi:hypothetical protein
LVKGKPWPADDEKKLKDWYTSGIIDYAVLAFSLEFKYSQNAIYQKLLDLGLISKEEEGGKICSSSSFKDLPDELPSVETMLKYLAAAIKALQEPGIDKAEVLRLRGIIAGAKVYQERFAEYVRYRKIEAELMELRQKYEALRKKGQGTSSK